MEKQPDSKSIIIDSTLDPYELAMFHGLQQTKASKAAKEKVLSEALNGVLSSNIELNGEKISVAEAIVIKTVADALQNPGTGKLKDIATIIGDVAAQKVEVATSKVDAELEKDAIKEPANGEE